MFGTGNTKPRLGIDLAGGTSITLSAKSSDPKAINKTNMDVATGIIEQRVNGMGVSEAEVQTQGDRNIIVNIPKGGDKQTAADQVGTTAKLFFRPVLALAPSGVQAPAPSATPSAGATGTPAAAPAATGTGSAAPSAAATGTPSASATKQGRPAGEALAADNTPSPVATTGAAASATPSAAPAAATGTPPAAATPPATPDLSAAMTSGTVPPELAAQFAALDCSKLEQRKNYQGEDGAPTVACTQKDEKGLYYKLALGPVAVQGKNVTKAQATIDTQQGGGWQVQLQFDGKGTDAFTAVTGQLAAQQPPTNQFAIVLDGQVVSHPEVRSAIPGGSAVISGGFGQEEAQNLANVLSFGALPLEFQTSDVTTVSPQLGGDQLKAGLVAGLIGMVLVVLYSLLYYRGLGLVSIAGLLVSAALTYSIMSLLGAGIGFALNLPAVCGAIVAIGITADSFIVYFERIRDEVREGALLRPAVQRAWPRARRTILVSDFVSFLCAAVLYVVSVGKVQGFAFTLGLTTALDVVVIFLFTKPLITLLARRKFFSDGHPWSGLDPKRLGARPPLRSTRRRNPSSSAAVKGA
ncbi:protein translocase subunit SecD [Kitasatospora purpeofusca]|nr:protein translocase subunit SecD [Kitasatospora purpeofusca]MCX4758179.1 protein translocase subunit SecD [Kitasatospora purpeofusca]WSR37146.1 protein translocase subunit SecD [Kitasatospora purpeofusca]WSR45380.1 protein translocase subunit SecD [Kitasatospora purpeofusca]